jgi:hypothetical protein
VAVALLGATATVASASDLLTVNTTSAYVDPSISEEFITVPNLCLEPYNSQATTDGCNELGLRAVQAIQGNSPHGDVYFEPSGFFLQTTNSFVPNNAGVFGPSGMSPIFSQHKYDLFGRGEDTMGPLNRLELLFMQALAVGGGLPVDGQTIPGSDTLHEYFVTLLSLPAGQTTYSLGGTTFNIADLTTYVRATGLTHGGAAVVSAWCNGYFGSAICNLLGAEGRSEMYIVLSGQVDVAITAQCTSQAESVPLTANCNARDQWMDQVVAGYVQAWDSLGGDQHFAENFRSQVGYDPNFSVLNSGTQVWTDFRLEQSVELSGAHTSAGSDPGDTITPGDNMDGIAGRQTFQQAFASNSAPGTGGLLGPSTIGQMVSQDVEGYFMSCLNCEQPGGNTHGFEPAKQDLTFMPYTGGWDSVPTIDHGGP